MATPALMSSGMHLQSSDSDSADRQDAMDRVVEEISEDEVRQALISFQNNLFELNDELRKIAKTNRVTAKTLVSECEKAVSDLNLEIDLASRRSTR